MRDVFALMHECTGDMEQLETGPQSHLQRKAQLTADAKRIKKNLNRQGVNCPSHQQISDAMLTLELAGRPPPPALAALSELAKMERDAQTMSILRPQQRSSGLLWRSRRVGAVRV